MKKNVLIGSCIAAGVIGLGLLAVYVYGAEKDSGQVPGAKGPSIPEKKQSRPVPAAADKPVQKPVRSTVKTPQPKTEPLPAETAPAAPVADEFPLRLGSKGKRVERLQVYLMRNYGWTGVISGLLDKETEALMKRRLKTAALDQATYIRLKMDKPVHEQTPIR